MVGRAMSMTSHAARRLHERGLSDDEVAAALAGRSYRQINGNTLYIDPASRVAVVINPQSNTLITAYRLRKSQIKRHYSR